MAQWERWLRQRPASPEPSEVEPEAPHRPSFVARTAGKGAWLLLLAIAGMFALALALRVILEFAGWLPLVGVVVIAAVVARRRGTDAVMGSAKRASDEVVRYFGRKRQ